MQYNDGETLIFTTYLGNSISIKEHIPTTSQTLSFDYIQTDFVADHSVMAVDSLIIFTDNSTGNPTSWVWDFGDGSSSVVQNPNHIYASAGNYTVSMVATNAYSSSTKTKTDYISIGNIPVAEFNAEKATALVDSTINFIDKSTGNPTSWLWTFGDGSSSTVQNPNHNYSAEGKYTVSLVVTNEFGFTTKTKTEYIKTVNSTLTDYDGNVYPIVIT